MCGLSQDMDSTRYHFYNQYLEKWIDYLTHIDPTHTECQSGATVATVAVQAQRIEKLKRKLDALLMEWTPANLNHYPMDVGMNLFDVCFTLYH